jgi:ribonuclease BN (tRNA processing enzyme)
MHDIQRENIGNRPQEGSMAELIVIGSGTGIPSLKRASPALIFRSGGITVLIDSGSGTLRRLLEVGITYNDIDLLLYTHIHPDHISDLVPILFACRYGERPRRRDLLCVGGPGFLRHFRKLKGLYGPWIKAESYRFTLKEVSERAFRFGEIDIRPRPTAHIEESVAYRITFKKGRAVKTSRSVTISGDTDYTQSIVDLASETDLLAVECSFPDEKKVKGHLTASLAGRIGAESRCKKLLLYHLYPPCDKVDIIGQCRTAYKGDLAVAEDLMRIEI